MKRIALLLAALLATPAQAQAPAPKAASERLWVGSAWYPEQWPEARWAEDLRLMKAQGANVVRIGEFAWSRIEPEEGHYDFGWLQRAVRLAAQYDLKVVIGTPTNTPPAWLTQTYPDTLRVDDTGVPAKHGGRRQFSISSPRYRALARDIVGRMADAVGQEPNVIGWQIDNEYTDESYDPAARAAWHAWLQAKYGTLDKLNTVWTTQYWSQTYSAWDQVPFSTAKGNPGWMLDLKRFITGQWVAFQRNQLEVLRAKVPARQFVTTNLGGLGWANRFDRFAINQDLDLASWDDYVGTGHIDRYRNGAVNDLARGWKRQNFWVMETQPGFVNWAPVSNMLYPGETRALAWQTVGHGADAVLFWQWRNALNGQESMHGSLIGADGKPLPIYAEARQIGEDFAKASPALAGTSPDAQVALLMDYDSRWAIDFQPLTRDYDNVAVLIDHYRPLKDAVGAVDVVAAAAPLGRYRLVVAPGLNVIPEALAAHLADYVRAGGHLVLGPRSGLKDEFNRLDPVRQPGPLADLLGGQVEQFYALDEPVAVGSNSARIWAEDLTVKAADAQVLLRYGKANGWLDGHPAAITRKLGKGRITYLGALLDAPGLRAFLDREMTDAGVTRDIAMPEDVELMTREGQGRRITILINHGRQERAVTLPAPMTDVLKGGSVTRVVLPVEGVAVLRNDIKTGG
ncbi:beta-galactosidase [Novosphingobium rosa]|uniref:beta-galactosidase n=1 Tax=Novosphingobium rosa TaxID=76978 RepID=UPI000B02FC87|nr:beta-galactosidase [Novosphingobium rosa]